VRIEHTQIGNADSDEDALEAKKGISESLSFMSKENAGTLLVFIVPGLASYLCWVVLTRFIGFLENANPSVASAVIGTMATLLVAFWSNLYVQRQVKLREIEEAHRPRKTEIYEEFLNVISRQLAASNPLVGSAALGEDELMKYLVKLQTQLILWGSPEVIKAFQAFKTSSSSDIHSLVGVDKLLRAIRNDIGLSIQGLDSYELVKMYLKDPQEMDDALPSNKVLQRASR
jgi:hypothetical protein